MCENRQRSVRGHQPETNINGHAKKKTPFLFNSNHAVTKWPMMTIQCQQLIYKHFRFLKSFHKIFARDWQTQFFMEITYKWIKIELFFKTFKFVASMLLKNSSRDGGSKRQDSLG